jgi:hypothetical protein
MSKRHQPRTEFLNVRDFDRLQHYRDRPLRWIKLYLDLLDDFDFQRLPDESKFHAVGLMLLAARMGNRLPNDSAFLSRQIGANTPIDLELLLRSGFIIPAKRKKAKGQSASSPLAEAERDASAEQDNNKTRKDKDKNKNNNNRQEQTQSAQSATGGVVVEAFKSKFSRQQILSYVQHCQKRQHIKNPEGLIAHLLKTGEGDAAIEAFKNGELLEVRTPESDRERNLRESAEVFGWNEPDEYSRRM